MSCPSCQAMAERTEKVAEQKEAVIEELVELRRSNRALKTELSKQYGDNPKMVEAQEVFDRWVQRLGKTKRTTFGPARQKAVFARLNEPALTEGERKADLLQAVEGMALMPFVGSQGRQAKAGPGAKRYDDLTLVCRDETTVERFREYVDEQGQRVLGQMVKVLEAWRPGCVVEAELGRVAHCPRCEKADCLCLIPNGVDVTLRCLRGCDPLRVRGALRELAKPRLAEAAA